MIGYIYRIRNLVNGKFYIGSTRQDPPRNRWNTGHVRDLSNGKHDNQRLQHSWNKHGEKAFVFEVIDTLEYVEDVELERREQEWLDKENPQYNICRKVVRNEWGVQKAAEKNSREYVLIDPEGKKFAIKNLRKFCLERGLNSSGMWQVATGGQTHHKGWICRYANMSSESFEAIRKRKRIPIIKPLKPEKIKPIAGTQLQIKFGPIIQDPRLGSKRTKHNPQGLLCEVISPTGDAFTCNDLKVFAIQHGLRYSSLLATLHGRNSHSEGWRVRYQGNDFNYTPKPREAKAKSWFIRDILAKQVTLIFNLEGFARKNDLRKDDQYRELRRGDRVYQFSQYEDFRDVPVKPGKTKRYQLTRPDGSLAIVEGLRKFCRDEGLDEKMWSKRLSDCATGRKSSYKGWTVKFV